MANVHRRTLSALCPLSDCPHERENYIWSGWEDRDGGKWGGVWVETEGKHRILKKTEREKKNAIKGKRMTK